MPFRQLPHFRPFRVHPRGFTLVEALVTITILAILVAASYPAMQRMIRRNNVSNAAQELQSMLSAARNQAIRRNGCVAACPVASSTSNACTKPSSGEPLDWFAGGWIVYRLPRETCDFLEINSSSGASVNLSGAAPPDATLDWVSSASTPILIRGNPVQGMHAWAAKDIYNVTTGSNVWTPWAMFDPTWRYAMFKLPRGASRATFSFYPPDDLAPFRWRTVAPAPPPPTGPGGRTVSNWPQLIANSRGRFYAAGAPNIVSSGYYFYVTPDKVVGKSTLNDKIVCAKTIGSIAVADIGNVANATQCY